jgi:hypothetical protein
MKITPIAVAAIVPAVIAGAAFSAVPFAQAAAAPTAAHTTARHVTHVTAPQDKARKPAREAVRTAARHHHHRHHPHAATAASAGPQQPAAGASTGQQSAATSGPAVTAGESSFEQCVAWRESGDTPTDPDGLFGILPSVWQSLGYSGTAGQASVAQQQAAFNRLYAEYGSQPWAPSDGC